MSKAKPDYTFHKLTTDAQHQALRKFVDRNPKSLCTCGHSGDGGNSFHLGAGPAAGHGVCIADDCGCQKFSWARWSTGYRELIAKLNAEASRGFIDPPPLLCARCNEECSSVRLCACCQGRRDAVKKAAR